MNLVVVAASAQLSCFVCTNCPEPNDLDLSYSQSCDLILPPTTQTPPHTPPTATAPTDPISGPTTEAVDTASPPLIDFETEQTIELSSIPTTTPQVPSPPPFFIDHKSIAPLLTGTHRCFRIGARGAKFDLIFLFHSLKF